MKCGILVCLVLFCYGFAGAAMTEKQIKAANKLVKNTCMPKVKVTEEQIDKIRNVDWENVERPAMCFLHCCLISQKVFTTDNKLDIEGVEKIAKQSLPEPRRSLTIDGLYKCQNSMKTFDDKCVLAFEFTKCFFDLHPELAGIP